MPGAYRLSAVVRAGHLDPHGALEVGASDLDPQPVEDREHVRVGMPVAVVHAGADEPDPRADRPRKAGIVVAEPWCGHRSSSASSRSGRPPREGRASRSACAAASTSPVTRTRRSRQVTRSTTSELSLSSLRDQR
jgi:hypothetical protein